MKAIEFRRREVERNVVAYGRWASLRKLGKADAVKILFENPPKNDVEVLQHGNALAATGNYPVGTDACFNVGIAGGCGEGCFVFQRGECPVAEEIKGGEA